MRSQNYSLAIEPCNCKEFGRTDEFGKRIPLIAAYSKLEYSLELGVLDGQEEIERFLDMSRTPDE